MKNFVFVGIDEFVVIVVKVGWINKVWKVDFNIEFFCFYILYINFGISIC